MAANHPAMKKARNAVPAHKKGPKFEIKRPEQILKKRNAEEKKAANRAKGKGKWRKGRNKKIIFYLFFRGMAAFMLIKKVRVL